MLYTLEVTKTVRRKVRIVKLSKSMIQRVMPKSRVWDESNICREGYSDETRK